VNTPTAYQQPETLVGVASAPVSMSARPGSGRQWGSRLTGSS
jgi:hypothetical protein